MTTRAIRASRKDFISGLLRTIGFAIQNFLRPNAVMLTCPLLFDLTLAHRIKGPFHPDRAEIDMGEDDSGQDQADKRMLKLRVLHLFLRRQWVGQVIQPEHARQTPTVEGREGMTKKIDLERE